MTDLTPVVVGGLIALVGGLIGAVWQSARENRRWIRNERLEVYAAYHRVADLIRKETKNGRNERAEFQKRMDAAKAGGPPVTEADLDGLEHNNEKGMAVLDRLEDDLYNVLSRLRILASKSMNVAGLGLGEAMGGDDTAYAIAVEKYMRAARKDLRVPES